MPAVSVVMPVRDAAATVGASISSICAQSFKDWELLVVDDGSRDGTAAVIESYARRDRRILLLKQPCSGIVHALQNGLGEARGEFIARMDADDISCPERLAEQTAYLRKHPQSGLVGSLVRFGGDRCFSRAMPFTWTG